MRTAICCLLLAIAAPTMAFRARPVSDLRFEDVALTDGAFPGPVAAASDGSDYLVVFRHETLPNIYAQVISQGVPYGPAVLIGHGEGISVIWTGSEYLVAWAGDQGMYLTAVSRRGALLSGPRLVMSGVGSRNAVSNGREILVTAERDNVVFGRLVSLNGDPLGNEFKIIDHPSGGQHALTGTADGFALALFGHETRFFHLDDAAKPREASGTLVEGPVGSLNAYFSSSGVLASDGTNVAVIFSRWIGSSDPQVTATFAMRSVIIDPRSDAIVQPRTLLSDQPYPAPEPNPGNVLWNGSEYVVVYSIAPALYSRERRVMLQRISRAGEPLDDPVLLSTAAYGSQWPSVIASNGRESMVTSGGSFVRLPIGSRNPTASTQLSRMVSSQSQLVMARRQDDFLAVWLESERDGKTIRASRIDAKGRYLDGTGIVLGTFPKLGTVGVYSWPTLSVDSDGKNWLVVWTYGDHVYGCRVSAAGVVLDPTPIAIPSAPVDFPLQTQGAVVRWGGTSWLVVSNTTRRVASTTVSSDGLVGPVKIIDDVSEDIAPRNDSKDTFVVPLLDFDGQQFVVAIAVFQLDLTGSDKWHSSIVTERLGLSGDPIGGSKFISQPELYRVPFLRLATNGSQDLIVCRSGQERGFHLQGLLLNRGFAPATIAIDQPSDPQSNNYDVAWNGNEFVVADIGAEIHFKHLSRLGAVRDTITLPRDSGECCVGNVVFPRSSPVGQTTLGADPPLGLVTTSDAWSGASRAQFAFAGDLAGSQVARPVPPAPLIFKAIGDPTGVTITWQPQDGVLGFDIELHQPDGADRVIGVAAGSASSTHISYAGLTGTAVRLRAWNAAGLSEPSPEVPLTTPRLRAVR